MVKIQAFIALDQGSIPGQVTKIPKATQYGQKKFLILIKLYKV